MCQAGSVLGGGREGTVFRVDSELPWVCQWVDRGSMEGSTEARIVPRF